MHFTLSFLAIAMVATCYMLVSEAANVQQDSPSKRRNLENNDYLTPESTSMTELQPFESLDVVQSKYGSSDIDPMSTAASHHHKKGAKGWLDMGAWTKKKGAFGWYADFPVGKGR